MLIILRGVPQNRHATCCLILFIYVFIFFYYVFKRMLLLGPTMVKMLDVLADDDHNIGIFVILYEYVQYQ